MNDLSNGAVGIVGCLLTSASAVADEVSTIVSIICTSAIALVTCFVQCYRLIKDRNAEKKEKIIEKGEDEK